MRELRYNKKLVLMLICGHTGYALAAAAACSYGNWLLGTYQTDAWKIAAGIVGAESAFMLVAAVFAVFMPNRLITYAACGVNMAFALALLLFAYPLVKLFDVQPSQFEILIHSLRSSAAVILISGTVCILSRLLFPTDSFKKLLIADIAATAVSVAVPFLLIRIYGIVSLSFSNIMQPMAAVFPLLFLNKDSNMTVRKNAGKPQASKYPYLEEYKRKKGQ